eukprot:588513-Rhodomonas_salina.2
MPRDRISRPWGRDVGDRAGCSKVPDVIPSRIRNVIQVGKYTGVPYKFAITYGQDKIGRFLSVPQK